MSNQKILLFTFLFLCLFKTFFAKVEVSLETATCNKTVHNEIVSFYNENNQSYSIYLSQIELMNLPCKIKVLKVDGMIRSLAWIELENYRINGLKSILVSQDDPSSGWSYEDEEQVIKNESQSYNFLKLDQNSALEKSLDVFWTQILTESFNEFDVNKKSSYFMILYFMHFLGFDNLKFDWITDFYAVLLVKNNNYLYTHFQKDFENAFLKLAKPFLDSINQKFTMVLHSEIEDSLFENIKLNPNNFISTEASKVYDALKGHFDQESTEYGRNTLAILGNKKFSPIKDQDLENFFINYDTTLNPQLDPFDYKHSEDELDATKLLKEFSELKLYDVKYFLLEKFELIGKKRPRISVGKVNIPEDNCKFTNLEKKAFVKLSIKSLVLKNDNLKSKDYESLVVSCEKTGDEESSNFRIILNPYNENKVCEVVFKREFYEDLDQDFPVQKQRILVDSYPQYTNIVSCERLTRGVNEGSNFLVI